MSENMQRQSRMPSSLKGISRRASQFFKKDRVPQADLVVDPTAAYSLKDHSDDAGCVRPLGLLRKRSRKVISTPTFTIADANPLRDSAPQLPKLSELGLKKVRKAKSVAVMGTLSESVQDDTIVSATTSKSNHSLDLTIPKPENIKVPGAFPSSSPPSAQRLANYKVSPPTSPVKTWLTYDKALNSSSETVVRLETNAQQGNSILDENAADAGRTVTMTSWVTSTSTEPDSGPHSPLFRQLAHHKNGPLRQLGITPSASTTSSVRQLPPHKFLRRQEKLPSQRRWASLDNDSHNTQDGAREQSALRRKFHLPSSVSRSKLQWGDMSSNFSSNNSSDLRQLRSELRLPSHPVSTPDLSEFRRTRQYVENLSEQPQQVYSEPVFNSSEIRVQVFPDQSFDAHNFEDDMEGQADETFFAQQEPNPDAQPYQQEAIINNLYLAVQRVDVELTRVHLENRQLTRSEQEANERATHWAEQVGVLEETLREKQKEKEDLVGTTYAAWHPSAG